MSDPAAERETNHIAGYKRGRHDNKSCKFREEREADGARDEQGRGYPVHLRNAVSRQDEPRRGGLQQDLTAMVS